MHGDGDDQQHQGAGRGQWLEYQAVELRTQRHHQGQGEQRLQRHGQLGQGQAAHQADQGQGIGELGDYPFREAETAAGAGGVIEVHGAVGQGQGEQQPDQGGGLAGLQGGHGQRAVGDELALGDQQDARDGEDQQDRQRQQRVDRAVGDAVLAEQQGYLEIHGGNSCCDKGGFGLYVGWMTLFSSTFGVLPGLRSVDRKALSTLRRACAFRPAR
ncbi:hypothetical protein D3C72_1284310 [compost metagenome]